jgi:putative ABC transport system permease protein
VRPPRQRPFWFLRRRPDAVQAEVDEELQAHLDMRIEELMAKGMSRDAARAESLQQFGDLEYTRRYCRTQDERKESGIRWKLLVDELAQDLRNGFRQMTRSPGFTAVAVLTLALGIGANSAIFSLINATLIKPLPYAHPDRLVMIWAVHPEQSQAYTRATGPEFVAWQREAKAFEAIATEGQRMADLGAGDRGEPAKRVSVQRLQPELFDVLGVRPMMGRPFGPEEGRVGGPAPVALLSQRLWEERFNRDPGVLNATIRVDGQPLTIIGVMPASFAYLSSPNTIDLYIPFAFNPTQVRGSGRGYAAVARLKPGVSIQQAQADMDAVMARIAPELPAPSRGFQAHVQPLHEALYGDYAQGLFLLEGIVGLVLLIACANVAGLFMARALSRSTEIAVRASLGAGRMRIIRQLLTESALLALLGGAVGIGVAAVMLKGLASYGSSWAPRFDLANIDGGVLAFTFAVSVVTGIMFGCVPALQVSRVDLMVPMKSHARGSTGGAASHRFRSALVMGQVALAVVLLAGAGLVAASFFRLKTVDLGADPRGALGLTVPFQGARYSQTAGPYRGFNLIEIKPLVAESITKIRSALQTLPGIQAVAGSSAVPFAGVRPFLSFTIAGRSAGASEADREMGAAYQVVTPGYFAIMRIPFVFGRDFNDQDAFHTPWGVVVNEAMARAFWPGVNPVGQRLTLSLVPDEQPREVIGVVRDARSNPYEIFVQPAMYALYTQQPPHTLGPIGTPSRNTMTFIVRSSAPPATVAVGIRRAMTEFDPNRPMVEIRSLEDNLADVTKGHRVATGLFGAVSLLAVLLATLGIYGIVSHGVVQRTREIGIRIALGARPAAIRSLILREMGLITGLGLVLGLGAAFLLTGTIRGLLFGVAPTSPMIYGLVAAVMTAAVLLAAWIPSERAARVPPTIAFRAE